MNMIHPISRTADTVTLSVADYDALCEAAEDAQDVASVRLVEAALAAGRTECLPAEMVERLAAGDHPLRVWRKYRGLTGSALAIHSGVSQGYISEIEGRRKPGSFETMAKLARSLRIDLDDLVDSVD